MTDDERDEALLSLLAEAEMMRSIVGILCVWTLPDDAIDVLVDELEVPLTHPLGGATNAAADRIAGKIAELRNRKRRRGY